LAEAIQQFETAVDIDPKYARAQHNLGVAMARKGNLDNAIAHFRSAIETDGRYPEPRYSLGMILYSRGQIGDAMAQWRAGLSADPDYRPILARVTWVLATCPDASFRNGPEAVTLAERLVKLADPVQPEVLDTLGAAYAEAGRFREASYAARRALRLATDRRDGPLAASLEKRLKLYDSHTPYRDLVHQ
jgi:protein O-mannosyl-transferase